MRIDAIDKNLVVETDVTEPDLVWFNIEDAPFQIYGVKFEEEEGLYTRMPRAAAERVSPGIASVRRLTTGGRVRFRTDSKYIAIKAVMRNITPMSHMPKTGQTGFDLYRRVEGVEGGREMYYKSFIPPQGITEGYSSGKSTDGKYCDYTINFPLYDKVVALYIGLKKDAHLSAPTPYTFEKPIVFYGHSATQGAVASRPGNSYPAMIARMLDADIINLGFSGKAKGEFPMAEYIATLDMTAFVFDYDHNTPSEQNLIDTHWPFYKKVREAHPDIPIVFMTGSNVKLLGNVNYAGRGFLFTRREIIRDNYKRAVAEGDKNVYFVDGESLFEGEMWDTCTVDGAHPNDLGFFRIAQVIGKVLKKALKI